MIKKFVLNRKGVSDLLKSQPMQNILLKKAKEIEKRCGSGYVTSVYVGKRRANASVLAKTLEARKDNGKNNTLLKAIK